MKGRRVFRVWLIVTGIGFVIFAVVEDILGYDDQATLTLLEGWFCLWWSANIDTK